MAALLLFGELRERGVRCTVADGQLVIESRRDVLTQEDRGRILVAKPALMRLFSEVCPCTACAGTHGLRLHCGSKLDLEPEWCAARAMLDAMDEAAERAAIQAEGAA